MASNTDWNELLDKKYPSYKIEVQAYLDSLDVANSIEVSTQFIFEKIVEDDNVSDQLKQLYREALFGTNKEVKSRIKNRVCNFKRGLKWVKFFLLIYLWMLIIFC